MIELLQMIAIFLVKIIFDVYLYVIIFRLLLQYYGADYKNPICQFIIKITDPIIKPLQTFIPRVKAFDLAIVLALFILEYLKILVVYLLFGSFPNLFIALIWTIFLSLHTVINFYFYAIIIYVVMSWAVLIQARALYQHPLTQVLFIVVEPVLKLIRKRLPENSRIDFSALIALILLGILSMIVRFILHALHAPSLII